MGAMGGLWGPMGAYGDFWGLWGPIRAYGGLWAPLGAYGGLWGLMGTYGDLWGPMGSLGTFGEWRFCTLGVASTVVARHGGVAVRPNGGETRRGDAAQAARVYICSLPGGSRHRGLYRGHIPRRLVKYRSAQRL